MPLFPFEHPSVGEYCTHLHDLLGIAWFWLQTSQRRALGRLDLGTLVRLLTNRRRRALRRATRARATTGRTLRHRLRFGTLGRIGRTGRRRALRRVLRRTGWFLLLRRTLDGSGRRRGARRYRVPR